MRIFCTIGCGLFAMVVFGAMALGDTLSQSEMASTIGGGNCMRCPTSTNASGPTSPCTGGSWSCYEYEGCDYKVCESYESPDVECHNNEDVTAYYYKRCKDGEGSCDLGTSSYDCSCHMTANTYKGCT